MADERELIAEREKKVAELRRLERNPYANGFSPTHTAREILDRFRGHMASAEAAAKASPNPLADDVFSVAGRIVDFRSFGKAAFVKILDRTDKIQVWVKKDVVG